jgi:hypothetical protein
VHLAIRLSPLVESPAARLLGSVHPLARALDRRTSLHLEMLVVGVLLGGSLIAFASGASSAMPVGLAAGFLAVLTWFRLMLLRMWIHGLVLELFVAGRGRLPLAEVQRERGRLLDVRRRRLQAQWLQRVADGRDLGFGLPGRVPPLISARLAAGVRTELLEVGVALTADEPGVAGLALLEQLAYEPWSPLFGEDVRATREALSRVRFLLAA